MVLSETKIDLDKLVEEIVSTFKPSTTFEQGELLISNYETWNRIIHPAQEEDWNKIKRKLRGTWGKLKWYEKAWVFNYFRTKFNWRGWSTTDGIALTIALQQKRRGV